MSTPTLPDYDTAFQTLNDVRGRVFFQTLANLGHAPQTEKEAATLLTLAGRLRESQYAGVKRAAEADRYADALAQLNGLLGDRVKYAEEQQRDLSFRAVAAELSQRPEFYNSVLTVRAAELDG